MQQTLFNLVGISRHRPPSRAAPTPTRAPAPAATTGAADPPLGAAHPHAVLTSESTTDLHKSLTCLMFWRAGQLVLTTGGVYARDSFGCVLSDLQSPGSSGRPAGAAFMGARAGRPSG